MTLSSLEQDLKNMTQNKISSLGEEAELKKEEIIKSFDEKKEKHKSRYSNQLSEDKALYKTKVLSKAKREAQEIIFEKKKEETHKLIESIYNHLLEKFESIAKDVLKSSSEILETKIEKLVITCNEEDKKVISKISSSKSIKVNPLLKKGCLEISNNDELVRFDLRDEIVKIIEGELE